jgi:hypothetical protein
MATRSKVYMKGLTAKLISYSSKNSETRKLNLIEDLGRKRLVPPTRITHLTNGTFSNLTSEI